MNIFWQKLLAQVFLFFKGIIQHQTIGARTMLIDGNKILLVCHGIGRRWQFPGGGVDVGESFSQAALREIFEETGYRVTGELKLHGVFHNIEATNRDHLAFYIARDFEKINDFNKSREIVEIAWFDYDDLPVNIAKSAKNRVDEIFFDKQISDKW